LKLSNNGVTICNSKIIYSIIVHNNRHFVVYVQIYAEKDGDYRMNTPFKFADELMALVKNRTFEKVVSKLSAEAVVLFGKNRFNRKTLLSYLKQIDLQNYTIDRVQVVSVEDNVIQTIFDTSVNALNRMGNGLIYNIVVTYFVDGEDSQIASLIVNRI